MTPFAEQLGQISQTHRNPLKATLCVAVVNTLIGLTYLGSTTAFNAFATSVICLILLSYLAAILPHLISGRSGVRRGAFWMTGWVGTVVHSVSCAYIAVFVVIFCCPYSMPVTAQSMNYSSVIIGSIGLGITICWLWKRKRGYTGFMSGVVEGLTVPGDEAVLSGCHLESSAKNVEHSAGTVSIASHSC